MIELSFTTNEFIVFIIAAIALGSAVYFITLIALGAVRSALIDINKLKKDTKEIWNKNDSGTQYAVFEKHFPSSTPERIMSAARYLTHISDRANSDNEASYWRLLSYQCITNAQKLESTVEKDETN